MKVAVGAKSDVGLVREGNEDSYLVDDPLFVVADGMGGHLAGDVASSTAVEVISEQARSADLDHEDALRSVVRAANSAIWEKAQGDQSLKGMGTTCTLVMVSDGYARLAHVGDSRAYLLRAGELSQLTEDHTLVGRMVREGKLSAEEAEHHPQRSIITRALGVDSDVDVDTLTLDLVEGDRLLMCSDGLTSMVGADVISDILGREADPQRAASALVDLAIENGGEDNVTVVLLDVGGEAGARGAGSAHSAAVAGDPGVPPPPEAQDNVRSAPENTVMTAARPAPQVVEEEQDDAEEVDDVTVRPRRRRAGRLTATLVVIAGLALGGFFLVRALLDRSYYVGLNDDDTVTIFRGIPDEIAGFSFNEVEQETDLSIDDLPEFLQDDVQEGMKADSLEDAQDTIANLEERAEERRDATRKKKRN